MIQGFINGIKNMIGGIGNAVSGIAGKIKSFLHFSRPDEGPLHDYETWMPDMIKGLAKSLNKNAPQLYNASKQLADDIREGMDLNGILKKMKATVAMETAKISTNLSTTANIGKVLTANINVKGDTYLDGTKVGRTIATPIIKTIKAGGVSI